MDENLFTVMGYSSGLIPIHTRRAKYVQEERMDILYIRTKMSFGRHACAYSADAVAWLFFFILFALSFNVR